MRCLDALRCVGCGAGGLQMLGDFLACPGCGRTYPVLADVPVMVSDASVMRGPLMDPEVVDVVLRAMDMSADPIDSLRIRRASGARAQFGDSAMDAGCAPFLERVRSAGFSIPETDALSLDICEPAAEPDDDAKAPSCTWITDYIPRALLPGVEVLANVRIKNTGATAMRHIGYSRVTIASQWRNVLGEIVPSEDIRTPLPRDLPPGQALTLPIALRPPHRLGLYTLSLKMVLDNSCRPQPEYGPLRIHLRRDAAFVPPPHWQVAGAGSAGAPADQDRSLALLRDWLAASGPAPRLLEVGGNAKPLVAGLPGVAYNVDTDLLALQIGCVVSRARGAQVHHVCADVRSLPFSEAFFDAAVIFASLHRCPDPVAALRGLAAHLRPGGFIGLFCEPLGHLRPGGVPPDSTLQIRHGADEQRFSLAEYAGIFRAARLDAAEVMVDDDILTARLAPFT
jgi:SAM-dependent methyltransferase